MRAMILAAGKGTRLRLLTFDCPKPMLPVAGSPVLEHTIRWLKYHDITEVAINLYHRPKTVTEHFENGSRFGVKITYSIEDVLLGTAGGVKRIADFFDSTFVVVYGDVLTDFDLRALIGFHEKQQKGARLSMCLYRVPNPTECGIVRLNEQGVISRFVEKPSEVEVFSNLANSGIMVVDPEILRYIPDSCHYDFGRDLLPCLLREGVPIYGWPLPDTDYLIDIGSPEKYERVRREWPTQRALRFTG